MSGCMTIRRRLPTIAVLALAGTTVAIAGERAVEPTALESFAKRPDVVLEREERIGELESDDARAELVVIVAGDTGDPDARMQGLRLRLTNNTGIEVLFLDEADLAAARRELGQLVAGLPTLEASSQAAWRMQGTERCWMPPEPRRYLCPGTVVGPDGPALTLAAFGGRQYRFPGRHPAEFAALLDQAAGALAAGSTREAN